MAAYKIESKPAEEVGRQNIAAGVDSVKATPWWKKALWLAAFLVVYLASVIALGGDLPK